jgi:lipopolysaccharide biosynthesis protein
MPDRLFLFAGFDKDCIIDDALIYYVKNLAKYGDVVLCMDCNCPRKEIDKIKKYTIHTIVKRHSEYDFGSYKRCFQYAHNKDILKNYDYLYLVNDSVFGPTINIKQTLQNIESIKNDACGMVVSKHKTHSFMESWFVCLNKNIFMSDWFNEFITSVQNEERKSAVTVKYEHGLTKLIQNNGCTWNGLYTVYGRKTYNNPKYLFKQGCPFVKKLSCTRHDGALGKQIKYILKHCDKAASKSIINSANRLYGKQYMNWFLTCNPLKILSRNIKYGIKKLKNGGI